MPSPLFPGQQNPNIFQIMNMAQQLRQNPSQIGQVLFDNHRINQTQLDQINRMGGNPQQIAQYLMQNGIMGNNVVQSASRFMGR